MWETLVINSKSYKSIGFNYKNLYQAAAFYDKKENSFVHSNVTMNPLIGSFYFSIF